MKTEDRREKERVKARDFVRGINRETPQQWGPPGTL